jgi:hypothetical protein
LEPAEIIQPSAPTDSQFRWNWLLQSKPDP